MTAERALAGLRVLVVEDEMMVAMLIEDFLEEFGCVIVGPVGSIGEATRLASTEAIDGAMLDMNIAGQSVYPVAQELAERDIPFIFVSGYDSAHFRGEYKNRPKLSKPFRRLDLQRLLTTTFISTAD
jgi:CheY-like chemotaxis protein